jgi:uncharacterized membrane protein
MGSNAKKKSNNLERLLPWILIIGGIVGIICSLVLTYDQIKIWQDPHYQPACSLNPVVSCGSVINSKQGDILGIPGPFFGLITFPVLVTVGAAMLAGAKFKRWFWLGMEASAIGGAGFALWLFWVSLYRVHALCPFCLTVDVVVYTTTWYITLHTIEKGFVTLPKWFIGIGDFARRHHFDILVLWFILIIVLVLKHFWYYYGKHL